MNEITFDKIIYLFLGLVYLKAFSHYTILSEVCLGIAFTGNIFQNNVLGVSYTAQATTKNINILSKGGICDRPYKSSPEINFNALAVAPRLKNGKCFHFIYQKVYVYYGHNDLLNFILLVLEKY